jgi:hypothetical protein
MAQNRPRYVSTFRAPTEYELEVERARRQKALAEALAQQEYQPMEGAAAPIPRAAPLVKALQGYLTARAGRQAEEAASKAGQMQEEYARRMAGRMEGGYVPPSKEEAARVFNEGQRTPEQIMAATPAETTLREITPTSRYVKAPEEALAMASTGLGAAALKDRPIMAARLAQMLESEKFYAPTETEEGLVQYGERGGIKKTGVKAAPKTPPPTNLRKLIDERDALPSDSPQRAIYDAAIKAETEGKGTTIQMPPTARDLQKDESGLRDQLQSRLKEMDWAGTQSAMQRIVTAPNTPIGDVDIVYAVAKAADSSGAVRKEDFDLRAKEGSYGGQIKSWYEEAKSGRMLPERRQQLIDSAMQFYQAREANVNKLLADYTGIAQRSGLNVENVVGPFKPMPLWSADDEKRLNELRKKAAGGAK